MKIALCQINSTVGSFENNKDSILKYYKDSIQLNADIIIFMFDARSGVIPFDYSCADLLRKISCPVLLVANNPKPRLVELRA